MKKIISIFLVISIFIAICPVAWADELATMDFEARLIQAGDTNPPQTVPEDRIMMRSATNYEGAYQALYLGMKNRLPEISMQQYGIPYNGTIIIDLYSRVINDNGDLFYLASSFSASGSTQAGLVTIYPQYLPEITETEIALFDELVEYVLSKATGDGMSDRDKVLAIHDYIVNHCEYDLENYYNDTVPPLSFTAYGVLANKIAVCQGYAIAMNHLLKKLGVEALYVASNPMKHGWSMVKVDGFWYHVDPTWDDPVPDRPNKAGHDLFLLSDNTMLERNHYGWDDTLPTCYSTIYETGYPFHGNNEVFHYRNGSFWFQRNGSYYRTDFAGENLTAVSLQDYIINPQRPYTLYTPIVYNGEGKVQQTTLVNLNSAKLAVDRHEDNTGNAYLFLAYFDGAQRLLQLSTYSVQTNASDYDLVSISEAMPQGAQTAKIFLWDTAQLTDISNLIQYTN